MATISTRESAPWTTMRVWDRRLAAGGCRSTFTSITSTPSRAGVQLKPAAGALAERLAQLIAAGEPQQRGQLRGEPSLDVPGRVQPVGHAATREPVVPGRPECASGPIDPLVASHPWWRRRRLDRTGGVAGGGQPNDDRTWTGPVVVEPEHRAAVVDRHAPQRPARRPGPHAWHQRRRGHRLGLQPQRLQIGAGEVADVQRRLAGLVAGGAPGDGCPEERQQRGRERQEPDAAGAPPPGPGRPGGGPPAGGGKRPRGAGPPP